MSKPSAWSYTHLVTCLVGLLMLISFPSQRSHQFTDHFRNATVRRAIACHTSIAQPEAERADSVTNVANLPTLLMPIDPGIKVGREASVPLVSQVPSKRLLLRLRLKVARADGQDPLL
jgi:hypothetical protein